MTVPTIAQHRLVNQRIGYPVLTKPSDLVASLGAMQAQDYLGALWAIGLRVPRTTQTDIEGAVADTALTFVVVL